MSSKKQMLYLRSNITRNVIYPVDGSMTVTNSRVKLHVVFDSIFFLYRMCWVTGTPGQGDGTVNSGKFNTGIKEAFR